MTSKFRPKHPVIVLYVEGTRKMPTYYHNHFDTAIPEASRLAELEGKDVYFIEYGFVPRVLGHMDIDGVLHQESDPEEAA
jgi:hypothetical protein